jgi:hypothetical protein
MLLNVSLGAVRISSNFPVDCYSFRRLPVLWIQETSLLNKQSIVALLKETAQCSWFGYCEY